MSLNLSPADAHEYMLRCQANQADKDDAMRRGDAASARKARQRQSALYSEFVGRQLPPPAPTAHEIEVRMSLADRIARIEQHLKLGFYSSDL